MDRRRRRATRFASITPITNAMRPSFIVGRVSGLGDAGQPRAMAAVLYRSNAQSRVFEEAVVAGADSLPRLRRPALFRTRGNQGRAGVPAADRKPRDDTFIRTRRQCTRPAGSARAPCRIQIREYARANAISLWESAALARRRTADRAVRPTPCRQFLVLVEGLATRDGELELHEQVDHDHQVQRPALPLSKGAAGRRPRPASRISRNSSAPRAVLKPDDRLTEDMTPLAAFPAHAVLESGDTSGDTWDDCVQLMTLHSVKGLEFPLVFMTGMEDGLFPHQRSI